MDCLSLYLHTLSAEKRLWKVVVVITWLEGRNLTELGFTNLESSCKFSQSLTSFLYMTIAIFIGLPYTRLSQHKAMFTHLRQSQTSQCQTISSLLQAFSLILLTYIAIRLCNLQSKTCCVWYSDIMVAMGPASFSFCFRQVVALYRWFCTPLVQLGPQHGHNKEVAVLACTPVIIYWVGMQHSYQLLSSRREETHSTKS